MKTIEDLFTDAKEKIAVGIQAEKDYCIHKNDANSAIYNDYASTTYGVARKAAKKVFDMLCINTPKRMTTIHMVEFYLNNAYAFYKRFVELTNNSINN